MADQEIFLKIEGMTCGACVGHVGEALREVAGVIEANPKAVDDYRGGKQSAIKFLVGQVMRETRGTSDPNSAAETLRRLLDAG